METPKAPTADALREQVGIDDGERIQAARGALIDTLVDAAEEIRRIIRHGDDERTRLAAARYVIDTFMTTGAASPEDLLKKLGIITKPKALITPAHKTS